jgi:hypothetical protein
LQSEPFRASIASVSPARRALLGVLSFVPTLGVVGLSVFATVHTVDEPDQLVDLRFAQLWIPGVTLAEAIALGIAIVALALVQIGVAIPLMLHARSSEHLTEGQKTLWSMLVLFVGSICAPLYWHRYIRGRGNAAPASTSASPTSASTRRS